MQHFKNEQRLAWDDLRLVLAIARGGSLGAAALALQISHPTVFRHARDLEQRLGVRLFERARSGYSLTTAGEEIHRVALAMEHEVEGLERRLAGRDLRPSGHIRVATVDTLVCGPLPAMLARFQQRYPQIVLDITTGVGVADLSRREADVALRSGGVPSDLLVGRKLCRIHATIYQARESENPATLDTLERQRWVMPDDSLSHLVSVRWLATRGLEKQAVLRANSFLALAQAARQDIGLAILPCYFGDADPLLRRVCAPLDALSSDLWLLTHHELRKVTRIRAFMDAISEEFRQARELFEG